MNKQLYMQDIKCQSLSLKMVETVEHGENQNCICKRALQYEIFDGILIVYNELIMQFPELFPLEEPDVIRMHYCIDGRCEVHYKNNKVFYVGTGDFVVGLLHNKQHKHNYPLGYYKGISIITTEKKLDNFLKTIFVNTQITSNMLLQKINEYGECMVLSNHSKIQAIMKEIIIPNDVFWKERATLKFAELVLLLINDDMEAVEVESKYLDKNLANKVKEIKKEVTENIELYIKIEEIAQKYDVSSRAFSDYFKEIYGKSYYAFIKEFRIKKAAGLICNSNSTIGEIAIMVGYQNASKFSKAFSDIMGVSPMHFKKNKLSTVLEQKGINGVDDQMKIGYNSRRLANAN